MAERPIFVPKPDCAELVKEIYFDLRWNPGFATVQKGEKYQGPARRCGRRRDCTPAGNLHKIGEQTGTAPERLSYRCANQELRENQA